MLVHLFWPVQSDGMFCWCNCFCQFIDFYLVHLLWPNYWFFFGIQYLVCPIYGLSPLCLFFGPIYGLLKTVHLFLPFCWLLTGAPLKLYGLKLDFERFCTYFCFFMDLLLGALVFGQLMDFPFTHLFRPIYGLLSLFTCFGLFYGVNCYLGALVLA